MKLNEENGLKLEIKRSEINALEREYDDLIQYEDDNLRDKAVRNILNILPTDKSVGIVYTYDPNKAECKIACFNKMIYDDNNTYKDNIEIHEQDWIIEEDES